MMTAEKAVLRWHWTGKGEEEANDRKADGKPGNRRYSVSKETDGTFTAWVEVHHGRFYGDTEAARIGSSFATKSEARQAAEADRYVSRMPAR